MKPRRWLLLVWYAVILSIYLIARSSVERCDWYIDKVWPFRLGIIARIMSMIPFSVGEILILLGVCYAIALVIAGILAIISKKKRKPIKILVRILPWLIAFILWEEVCNGVLLINGSSYQERNYPETSVYTAEELYKAREEVVKQLNQLSQQMTRDEQGYVTYDTSKIQEEAKQIMQDQAKTESRLAGYYPNLKKILFSDFMSQQYTLGIYFSTTIEANYNTDIYICNLPATFCHELSHIKGFEQEEEANFIGFRACVESDNPFFQYSGYLSVYNYLQNAVLANITDEEKLENMTKINELVQKDNVFLTSEMWEKVEKNSWFQTKTVQQVSYTMTDYNIKLYGVEDGMKSYSRVVQLVLEYYR